MDAPDDFDERDSFNGGAVAVAVVAMLAVFFTCLAIALLFPC